MNEMLAKMIALATAAHHGQFDKGGMPYILHPLTVMHKLKTTDIELMCIALGHDLIEDTYITPLQLQKEGMSERVIKGIVSMTKIKGEDYEHYKDRVKANRDSILVKMSDLKHNTDLRRLKGVTDKDLSRHVKYIKFYKELKDLL